MENMETNLMHRTKRALFLAALGSVGILSGGCMNDEPIAPTSQGLINTPPVNPSQIARDALEGVDAGNKDAITTQPPIAIKMAAAQESFITRNDPFALLRQESAFEKSQRAERLLSDVGWMTYYQPPAPPPEVEPGSQVEPQPYRRLSGILIGDTVVGIMELENGTTIIVRPGTKVPNTDWTVVSLDSEKAVLRRPGPRKPTQIVVRLENPRPAGFGGGSGGGTGGGTGGNQPGTAPPGGGSGGGAGTLGGGL
jgi:hypothetical protein